MKGKPQGLGYENLSRRLVEEVPELEDAYRKELEWWGEETPGPHIIYGDVLTPYIIRLLESGDDPGALRRAFDLLERMIADEDLEVGAVAVVTVLERLQDSDEWLKLLKPYAGPLAREAVRDLVQFWQGRLLDW